MMQLSSNRNECNTQLLELYVPAVVRYGFLLYDSGDYPEEVAMFDDSRMKFFIGTVLTLQWPNNGAYCILLPRPLQRTLSLSM